MMNIKQLSLALAGTLCALFITAQAQTPSIEVATDSQRAQFTVEGEAQEMRVEIYAPSGEMVFDSGTTTA